MKFSVCYIRLVAIFCLAIACEKSVAILSGNIPQEKKKAQHNQEHSSLRSPLKNNSSNENNTVNKDSSKLLPLPPRNLPSSNLKNKTENNKQIETKPQNVTKTKTETEKTEIKNEKPLRIAFCITGQLARLELLSKIKNIFIENAKIGNIPHIFMVLDNDIEDVKQTYWKYNYSTSIYGSHTAQDLKDIIDHSAKKNNFTNIIKTFVRLEPPSRGQFEVFYNESITVSDKNFVGHDGPRDNFEPAASRFQNNMRWMAGLRECAK